MTWMIVRDIFTNLNPKRNAKKSIIIPDKTTLRDSRRTAEAGILVAIACGILLVLSLIQIWHKGLRFKDEIKENASEGFEKIVSGAGALGSARFEDAKKIFTEAQGIFTGIQNKTWFSEPKKLTINLNDPTFEAANAVQKAGEYLASAGVLFTQSAEKLESLPKNMFAANLKTEIIKNYSLTEKLKSELPNLISASENLKNASLEIQKVPLNFIPPALREKFDFAKKALAELSGFLSDLERDIPAILILLGDKEPHTFLVLLQNNAELRPSGGFVGNYMLIETNDGYITKTEVNDIYSADHNLNEKIDPPEDLKSQVGLWYMRDSNYSSHFPLSAAKAAWFLEKEGGPGVDSVIAIDQTLVGELLKLSGPVKLAELPVPLKRENFSLLLSYIVESKLSGKENPKAILKSFLPAFEKQIFTYINPKNLLPVFKEMADGGHLQAFSNDATVQDFFKRAGVSGEMQAPGPKVDYFALAHTSIGGTKSDQYVQEKIRHDTYLKLSGEVVDEVTVTRSHTWNSATERSISAMISNLGFGKISPDVWHILGRGDNIEMFRLYVPKGSTLETPADPKLSPNIQVREDNETGKTYFLFKIKVGPLETASATIRYKLPFKLNLSYVDNYILTVDKQPGQTGETIQKRILPESTITNYKAFPEEGRFNLEGVWSFESPINKDMKFAGVWGK